MHPAVRKWVQQWAPTEPVTVIDVGGRDVNGTVRDLFHPDCTWTVVDPVEGGNVDVVADFTAYRHPTRVDVVVCTEVAEHCPRWPFLIANAARNLKTGGLFIFTAAGPGRAPHSAVAATGLLPGEFYENVEPERLNGSLRWYFIRYEVDIAGTDIRAVAWT